MPVFPPLTVKETLIRMLPAIEGVLGVAGIGSLGVYELMNNGRVIQEVPAIEIRYPLARNSLPKRIKKESGIECVIGSVTDDINIPKKRGREYLRYYEIVLIQHDPYGNLTDSIEALMANPRFLFRESPIIRKAIYLGDNEGIQPARAILYNCQNVYVRDAR